MIGPSKYINMILYRIKDSKYKYYNENNAALLHNIFKCGQFLTTSLRWMRLICLAHLWLLFIYLCRMDQHMIGGGGEKNQGHKLINDKRNIPLFFFCLVRGGWFSVVWNSSGISERSEDSEEQLSSQLACWEATLTFLSKPYSVADCKKLSGRVT